MTALIYDKASSRMRLTSGTNVFRHVFVSNDILNISAECLHFCNQKKNQVISAKKLLWSHKGLYFFILCRCRLDRNVQIKFGLRPDIWSDLEDDRILDWSWRSDQMVCHHLKNLCKSGLRPKFGLRT